MTNDEILQAAKDSYLDQLHLKRDGGKHYILDLCYPEIERFAAIIEKRTIERCESACNEVREEGDSHKPYEGYDEGHTDGCNNCISAIRKLGEQ